MEWSLVYLGKLFHIQGRICRHPPAHLINLNRLWHSLPIVMPRIAKKTKTGESDKANGTRSANSLSLQNSHSPPCSDTVASGETGAGSVRQSPAVTGRVAEQAEGGDRRKSVTTSESINRELIAKRAWEIWQAEGCPDGRDVEHWVRAEKELRVK